MKRFIVTPVAILAIVVAVVGAGYWHAHSVSNAQYKTQAERDPYVRFDMEAFDAIKQNYWKQTTDADLSQLFQLSLQKAENDPSVPALATTTRTATADMLESAMQNATSSDARKQLAENTLIVALYNLIPAGRDELFSTAQVTALRQTVANVNPSNDLYQNLGVQKGATPAQIADAFKQKQAELAHATSTAAQAELKQASYAYTVLGNANSKTTYDQSQVEPTVFAHVYGSTLYLDIDKISPTTIGEFARAVDSASTTPGLSSMILDLRGNIGGDLTFPQYFLGLFLGENQYAFDLYHQGDYQPQRTVTPKFAELDRYKEYTVLTDGQTQSTAELLTATLKRQNIAHVVGTKTRGWGSVENTYPLTAVIDPTTTYSLLLVNSLTLRDDNQPIEMNGVLPDVDTSVKGWQSNLPNFFHSANLIDTLRTVAVEAPQQ